MRPPLHDASAIRNVERTLSTLIDLHGPTLLHEEARLQQQLDRQCPDAPRANGHLLAALRQRIPLAMLAAQSDAHLQAALPDLVDRLTSGTGIEPEDARWAVRTWALALALPTTGLDDGSAVPHVARMDADDASQRSSAAHVLGFGRSGDGNVAVDSPRRTPAVVAPPVAVVASAPAVPVDAGREVRDDRPGDVAPTPVAASMSFATEMQTSSRPGSVLPAAPVPDVAAVPVVASPRPTEARAEDDAATAPIAMPAWSLPPPSPSRRPWGIIGTAVAAIVVVVVATRWTEAPVSPSPTPSAVRPRVPERPAKPDDVAVSPAAVLLEPRTPAVQDGPTPAVSGSSTSAVVESPPSSSPPGREPAVITSGLPPSAAAIAEPLAAVEPTAERPVAAKPPAPPLVESTMPEPAPVVARTAPATRPRGERTVAAVKPPPAALLPAVAACGRASCGSVVAARAVEDDASSGAAVRPLRFEMTLRMDDRSIGTVVDSVRWPNGTRVRKVGARIERLSTR